MLKAEHLHYTVDDLGAEETIIHDVSFAVGDGEILVVTGPNGGGKSTIAKLLMGIAQPTGGQIFLNCQSTGAAKRESALRFSSRPVSKE